MASWIGNRTRTIYRSRKLAETDCGKLNADSDDGWTYKVIPYGDGRRGWYMIEVTDETGTVLGVL